MPSRLIAMPRSSPDHASEPVPTAKTGEGSGMNAILPRKPPPCKLPLNGPSQTHPVTGLQLVDFYFLADASG